MIMRNRIKKHTLKFISVVIAVFIWIYVLNSEKVQFEKVVYIDYILPEDMVFSLKPPQEATYIIKGVRAFVRSVMERKDRIVVDLSRSNSLKDNKLNIELGSSQLKLPYGMRIEKIIPQKLNIWLDKKERKIVPLKLQFFGELPKKLILDNPILSPSHVEVLGPKSVISGISELPINAVDLSSLPGQNEIVVGLTPFDERISLFEEVPIKLSYQIKASTSNFGLKNLPIRFISSKRKIIFDVKTADVRLFVSDKIIKSRLNVSSSIQVWAEVPEQARGRVVIPLRVILPPSMHLLEISPKTIIVNVE